MVEYLSYSSINMALTMPYTFYLLRIKRAIQREPQGLPASNGSAFDYYCKKFVAEKFNKQHVLPELRTGISYPESWTTASILFANYLPLFPNNLTDIEVNIKFTFEGVPFYVKLDAVYDSIYPFDWKVAGSEGSASPTQGYKKLYEGNTLKGAHSTYTPDMTLPAKWRNQMGVYNWQLRGLVESKAMVHEITKTDKGKQRLAVFEGKLTVEDQEKFLLSAQELWKDIQNNEFEKRLEFKNINIQKEMASKERWY